MKTKQCGCRLWDGSKIQCIFINFHLCRVHDFCAFWHKILNSVATEQTLRLLRKIVKFGWKLMKKLISESWVNQLLCSSFRCYWWSTDGVFYWLMPIFWEQGVFNKYFNNNVCCNMFLVVFLLVIEIEKVAYGVDFGTGRIFKGE